MTEQHLRMPQFLSSYHPYHRDQIDSAAFYQACPALGVTVGALVLRAEGSSRTACGFVSQRIVLSTLATDRIEATATLASQRTILK